MLSLLETGHGHSVHATTLLWYESEPYKLLARNPGHGIHFYPGVEHTVQQSETVLVTHAVPAWGRSIIVTHVGF